MSNAASAWVASKSASPHLALVNGNIIEICVGGPRPREDAESYARDYVMETGNTAYVYQLEVAQIKGFKIYKEVNAFVPPQ